MDDRTNKKNIGWRVVHYLVLAGIVYLAWRFVDFGRVWQLIVSADPRYVAAILVLATIDRLLMALKWRPLLRAVDIDVPAPAVVGIYYQASIVSYVPFMVIGSDLLRAYLVSKRCGRPGAVFATIIVEKALGVLSAGVLGAVGLAFVLGSLERRTAGMLSAVVLGSLLLFLVAFGVSLYEPLYRRLQALMRRFLPEKICGALDRLHESYLTFRRRGAVLIVNLLLTMLEHFAQIGMMVLAGLALHVEMPVVLLTAVIALVLLLRRAAIYLEGWGFAETISVILFGLVSVDPATAVSMSLVANGVAMIAALPGALLLAQGSFRLAEITNWSMGSEQGG